MSFPKLQSGRTVGRMRQGPKRTQGHSTNACNRGSRHPDERFPLGKYREWDRFDPTGLQYGAKGAVVPDRKGLAAGFKVTNFLNRSR